MSVLTDLRFALRLWRRHPSMVAVAGISLGLGVGATTTMYSVVNKVAHYKLGFKDVDRLVIVSNTDPEHGNNEQPPTFEIVQALRKDGTSFEDFGGAQFFGAPVTLSGTDETSRVLQMPVDVGGLSVVGVPPLLGRTYRTEGLRRRREAEGGAVHRHRIRDVATPPRRQERRHRLVLPRGRRAADGDRRDAAGIQARALAGRHRVLDRERPPADSPGALGHRHGRLKPGVSLAAAEAEVASISRHVLEARARSPEARGARVVPIQKAFFGGAENILTFLLGAVSFVLLIACANVANLLLAAGAARQKELALRAATGAGRGRLVRQLLTENLVLSLVGCGCGLVLAFWGTRLFALIVPTGFPELLRDVHVDLRVLAFALVVSVASSLVFGLLPALRASRVDLNDVLKEGGRGGSGSRQRGRAVLLVAEVGLSMVLLVGAGLMMRAFLREQKELPGFDTRNLLTADILLGGTRYFDKTPADMNVVTPEVERFYDRVLERVRALPGVERAGIASRLPFQAWTHPFVVVGKPAPEPGKEPQADFNEVDAQLLRTLDIRLLRGRMLEERDTASAPWVAVVNKTFADRHFPGGDAIGKAVRFSIGPGGDKWTVQEPQPREIVGIVADVAYPSFFRETPAAAYVPFRQHVWQYGREDEWIHTRKSLVVRTAMDPMSLVHSIEGVVREVDRDQAAHDFMTMDQRVSSSPSVTNSRFFASLFTTFGVLAILLAMVGVYGVMSWVVGQRTSEFGIRMALGARARDVVTMLLAQSLRPILIGLVLGALGGFGLSKALNAMFWQMTSADPLVFSAIAALMLAAAMAAAWVPVHRVTRIDPQQALRYE
jgi:putative ABC transport system permease protein